MTDIPPSALTDSLSGKMFLYEQPELLTLERHGALGVTPENRPFERVANVRVIPLAAVEFASAQRHYPVVFSDLENPVPLAVVGILDDVNLFVSDGQWDSMCYIPSYLRCYPFAFASSDQGRVSVVVDRAASIVTEDAKYPFFEDGEPTKETQSMVHFCAKYEAERNYTSVFCKKLKELGLLTARQATYKPDGDAEEQAVANFVGIDGEKLANLDATTVHELHRGEHLPAIYLQLHSQDNWRHLMARRSRRTVEDREHTAN